MGHATIFPTGVTIYDSKKCFNGYTIFQAEGYGAVLMDMNGHVVHMWNKLQGHPNKLLPGGYVMGSSGNRDRVFSNQDWIDVIEVDWEGNIVWKFDAFEKIYDNGKEEWCARQHHDYQREGNPVGYYVPGMDCQVAGGNTLILAHTTKEKKRLSGYTFIDDCIYEVNWQGDIVWRWDALDHFQEFQLNEIEKNAMARNPNLRACGMGDWAHINSMSVVGPNKWYDAGDERFNPENIIFDSRELNYIGIIDKKSGKIVWKMGGDFTKTRELRMIGQIIGQHHAHIIPKGLPGEGNLLVFDNGGGAGFGVPDFTSKDGTKKYKRDYSRVLEINPITLKIEWEYTPIIAGFVEPMTSHYFYSPLVSSAQRLPNGNTLITEGCSGRFLEVTVEGEIVWEYVYPYRGLKPAGQLIYRAYRYPYEYVPHLETPEEKDIPRTDNVTFRMPNAAANIFENGVDVVGMQGYEKDAGFCVEETDKEEK